MVNKYAITCSRWIFDYVDDFAILEAKTNSPCTIFVNSDSSLKWPIIQKEIKKKKTSINNLIVFFLILWHDNIQYVTYFNITFTNTFTLWLYLHKHFVMYMILSYTNKDIYVFAKHKSYATIREVKQWLPFKWRTSLPNILEILFIYLFSSSLHQILIK